jgi:hypothetical protein
MSAVRARYWARSQNRRAVRKVPVFDTASAIFVFAWRERGAILRLSWFPLLLSSLAWHLATDTGELIGARLVAIAAWAVVAAALHRLILFGDRAPNAWLNIRFGKVEALFAILPALCVATPIALSALGIPTKLHLTGDPAVVAMIVMAVVIFFLTRFSLVFPIAVIERRVNFAQAWALSHANVWRMIGLWLIVTMPALLVADAWESILLGLLKFTPAAMTKEQFDGSLLELAAVTYPMSIVLGALCVGILSFSYKALAGFARDAVLTPKG